MNDWFRRNPRRRYLCRREAIADEDGFVIFSRIDSCRPWIPLPPGFPDRVPDTDEEIGFILDRWPPGQKYDLAPVWGLFVPSGRR